MPRLSIYHSAGWSEPLDYCSRCYPSSPRAVEGRFPRLDRSNFDLDVEHPPYTDDVYSCESCGKQLGDRDS